MSFLKKLFAREPVPAWASHMSESDFRAMKRDVEAVIRKTGQTATYDWETGVITLGSHGLGLHNLSQLYRQVPVGMRPALIADFMGVTSGPDGADLTEEEMRSGLRVRVQPADYLDGSPINTWIYPVCDGLIAVTAIDTPKTVVTIQASEMESRGLTQETACERGLANLKAHEPFELQTAQLPDGSTLRLYSGDSMFVASHVLRLDEILGDHDAFVFIPTRHELLVILKDDLQSQDDLGRVAYQVGESYEAGPGSISPACFAWTEGKLSLHWQPGQES